MAQRWITSRTVELTRYLAHLEILRCTSYATMPGQKQYTHTAERTHTSPQTTHWGECKPSTPQLQTALALLEKLWEAANGCADMPPLLLSLVVWHGEERRGGEEDITSAFQCLPLIPSVKTMKVTLRRGPIRARPQTPAVPAALQARGKSLVFFCVCVMCLHACFYYVHEKISKQVGNGALWEHTSQRAWKQRKDVSREKPLSPILQARSRSVVSAALH